MTLHELRKSYEELRRSRTRGRITDAQYQQSISRLRYQDRNGVWYQIDPRDGGLLRWTGQQWERSVEGAGARSSDQGMAQDVPRQFFPLMGRIMRLTLRTFFRRIPMTLVYAVLYTLILWGAYFGIMAFKNDGFNGASAFDRALGWGGGDTIQVMAGLNGGIFIAVVITLMVGVYSVVRRQGLSGAFAELMRIPGEIRRYFANAGELALAGLVSGTGVGLVIGSVVSGYTSIALALGVGALIVSTGGQTIALLVRSSWESTYSMVRGGSGSGAFNKYTGYVAMMGTSLGFVLRIYINTWTTSVVLGVILLIIAMFLSSGKGRAVGHLMLYVLGAYVLLDWVSELSVVMADDRGPAELNMKFSEWYKSEHGKIIGKIARNQATATGLSASLLTTLTRSMTNVLQSGMPGGTQYDEEGQRKWESYEERPRTTWSGEDKIVSGDGAIKWLKDNGMMDKDGRLNNKFREWNQRLPGDTRPTDLEGVAGDIDVEGKQPQGKNITIVFREKPPGPGKGQSPPPDKSPVPPPGKTPVPPPGKTPVPPPGKTPVPPPGKTPVPPPGKTPVPPPGKTPVPPPGKTPVPPPPSPTKPPPAKSPPPGSQQTKGPNKQLTKAWKDRNPMLVMNPNYLFTSDYMITLIAKQYNGADSTDLRIAMEELSKNPQGKDLERVLKNIANIRGRSVDQIKTEYGKYLNLRKQRDSLNPEKPADLHKRWSGFMGSITQLRYGGIVGDAFGVDPVFGALLNPSGGRVGPENESLDLNDYAVGYHGIVHDSAGYLYNYHKVGPGYDYLHQDQPRDTSHPFTGQHTGIKWWREELSESPYELSGLSEITMRYFVGTLDEVEESMKISHDIMDKDVSNRTI